MKRSRKLVSEKNGKPSVTLSGTPEKLIPAPHPSLPEKAQIAVQEADHMYRELRMENSLEDVNGTHVSLKPDAEVDVTIEADSDDTAPQNGNPPASAPASK